MEWSTVFDGDSYTAAEVIAKLSEMKLADLASGEYVAKEKLDKAIEKRKAAEADLATYQSQLDGDAGLKQQVEKLTAELEAANRTASSATASLTRQQRIEAAMKRTGDPKLAKLAVLEAENLVGDDTDFDDALEQVITSDPSYVRTEPAATVSTGRETAGAAPSAKSPLMQALEAKLG